MMKKIKRVTFFALFLTIFLLSSVKSAQSAFYKYTDKNGAAHFTDRYEVIPPEYQNQIKILREEKEIEALPALKSNEGNNQGPPGEEQIIKKIAPEPAQDQIMTAPKDEMQEKISEENYRILQDKLQRIEELKKQIEEKQLQKKSLRTTWMVNDRNTINRLNREIEALQKEIQSIQDEFPAEK